MINSPITQNRFCKKRSVSSTPNAYFVGFQFLKHSKCVGHSILPHKCSLQRASRLRKTHIVNKRHFPPSVSSNTKCTFEKSSVVTPTANATYFEKVTSRLHQMPTLGAEPTRTEPNRAGPLKLSLPPPSIFSSPQLSIFCPARQQN